MQIASPFPAEIRRVGVFSCSGTPDAERMAQGTQRMREWGVEVVPAQIAGGSVRYLAGSDEARAQSLQGFYSDDTLSFLMASRGGFGVTRLLDKFDWELLRAKEKWLCGYSDVTALLLAAYAHGCRKLIHGPMLCSTFGREDTPALAETVASFGQCLRREPTTARCEVLREGTVCGPIIPCNLTMLCSLLGTKHVPDLRGCILALEDVHEPAHSIERNLVHLESAGVLRGIGGLLLGQFTEGEDAEYLPEIFAEWGSKLTVPVASGLPFGHGLPSISILFGAEVTLCCQKGLVQFKYRS